jgi:hypothetical protein
MVAKEIETKILNFIFVKDTESLRSKIGKLYSFYKNSLLSLQAPTLLELLSTLTDFSQLKNYLQYVFHNLSKLPEFKAQKPSSSSKKHRDAQKLTLPKQSLSTHGLPPLPKLLLFLIIFIILIILILIILLIICTL